MLHGYGVYTWPDGRKYEGEYQNDQKHGKGIYTWPDGKKYDGGWKESKQHGEATITNAKGQSKSGIWENGERVKWIRKTIKNSFSANRGEVPVIEELENGGSSNIL